jgi:hypothetical protein
MLPPLHRPRYGVTDAIQVRPTRSRRQTNRGISRTARAASLSALVRPGSGSGTGLGTRAGGAANSADRSIAVRRVLRHPAVTPIPSTAHGRSANLLLRQQRPPGPQRRAITSHGRGLPRSPNAPSICPRGAAAVLRLHHRTPHAVGRCRHGVENPKRANTGTSSCGTPRPGS